MSFDPADWPELPPEVVELLVAPVVVPGTPDEPVPAPQSPPSPPAPPAPAGPLVAQQPVPVRHRAGECMPRFLAPAALSRTVRRAGRGPDAAGGGAGR